jgi:hypothetical protein
VSGGQGQRPTLSHGVPFYQRSACRSPHNFWILNSRLLLHSDSGEGL